MALYKQSEFAELCGISTDSVYVYKKRSKIVVKDGYIDGDDPINEAFLKEKQSKKALKPAKQNLEKQKNELKKEQKQKNSEQEDIKSLTKRQKEPEIQHSSIDIVGLNAQKLLWQIKKLQKENDKLKIDNEKKQGELLPIQLVENIFMTFSEGAKISFVEAAENLLVILTQQKGYSKSEYAELRAKLLKLVNTAIEGAKRIAMKQKDNLLKEFSDEKGVGDHG